MSNDWTRIGAVGLDSGTILVVDPCYVLHKQELPDVFGTSWEDFVRSNIVGSHGEWPESKALDGDMGVVIHSPHGDGVFPVWGRIDEHGRVMEIRILFD